MITPLVCDLPIALVPPTVTEFDQLRDFERDTCEAHGAFVRAVCHIDLEMLPTVSKATRDGFLAQKFDFCVIQQLYPGARKRDYFHGAHIPKGGDQG